MFGPLPSLHRNLLLAAVVLLGLGVGIWLGLAPNVPFQAGAGAVLGILAGGAVAWLALHDFHHDQAVVRGRRTH